MSHVPVSPEVHAGGRFASLLRAFNSRNYRLFFGGQLVSLVGTWLTNVAISWLVNRLTDSPRMLGFVNFAGLIPAFCLAPFAGVLVDRWNKHRLLIWTQILSMLQSFGLAIVAFMAIGLGHQTPAHTIAVVITALIALASFQGLINAFDIPTRQSFVVQMVERREDLPNAIALNSTMFNFARLVGPFVAGFLIYAFHEGWCFTIDGVSYLAVIVALLMMRVKPAPQPVSRKHVFADLADGVKYAAGMKSLRAILLLLAVGSLAVTPQSVLLPQFVTRILHGDSRTQGFLTGALAIGALLGAIRLAGRKSVLGLGRIMPLAAAGMGLSLIVFGWSSWFWLSFASLVLLGFCMMTQMVSGNTLIQTIVEDRMRGRVMSLYTMAFMGMMPIGSLISGFLAEPYVLGPRYTTALGGGLALVGAVLFASRLPAIRGELRPLYISRGILPNPDVPAQRALDTVVEESER
jgi:MFS family permease